MKRLRWLQLATSCLLVLGAALGSEGSSNDLESRRDRLEARIAAKLARLERLGQPGTLKTARNAGPAVAVTGTGSETVTVDCARKKSVSEAIARSKARFLRVEVQGTCAETVVVERLGVTISGTAAGGATIAPPVDASGVPTGPAIRALGAHELVLEDLVLTGGLNGLNATDSRSIRLTRVRAVSNPGNVESGDGYGVWLIASQAIISDSELSSNGSLDPGTGGPIFAYEGSDASVVNTPMTDNGTFGPLAFNYSILRIVGCTVARNGTGAMAVNHSRVQVDFSTVGESAGPAPLGDFAQTYSLLRYLDSTMENPFDSGALNFSILQYRSGSSVRTSFLRASNSSRIEFRSATFQAMDVPDTPSGVFAESRSFVEAAFSDINGDVFLSDFSDGSFETRAAIAGRVSCAQRSRVFTNQPPAGGISGCE